MRPVPPEDKRGGQPKLRHTRHTVRPTTRYATSGDVHVASTVKRHLADLRARSGLTTEQLIYTGRAAGWLIVPSLEASYSDWNR
jgi:hypothetical protein